MPFEKYELVQIVLKISDLVLTGAQLTSLALIHGGQGFYCRMERHVVIGRDEET